MSAIRAFYETRQPRMDPGLEVIVSYLCPKPQGSLLEIGCFDGSKTILFRDQNIAASASGVDIADDHLAQAKERGIQRIHTDFNNDFPLSLPPAAFDVITGIEVIEHVSTSDDLLDENVRPLKPEGYLLLTTPNLASWKNRIVLALGWQPFAIQEASTQVFYGNPLRDQGLPAGHIRLFTLPALLAIAVQAGLRPAQVGGLSLPSPLNNIQGCVSRAVDSLTAPLPALKDRLIIRFEKSRA